MTAQTSFPKGRNLPVGTRVKSTCPACGDTFVGLVEDRFPWRETHRSHLAPGQKFEVVPLRFVQIKPEINEDELVGGAYDDMTGERLS